MAWLTSCYQVFISIQGAVSKTHRKRIGTEQVKLTMIY